MMLHDEWEQRIDDKPHPTDSFYDTSRSMFFHKHIDKPQDNEWNTVDKIDHKDIIERKRRIRKRQQEPDTIVRHEVHKEMTYGDR